MGASTFEEQEFGLGAGFDSDSDSSDDGIPLHTSKPASKPKASSLPKASAGMDSSDEELLAYLEEADSDADSEEEEEIRKLHAKREARVQDALRRKLAGLPVEPASAAVDDSDDDFGLSSDDDEIEKNAGQHAGKSGGGGGVAFDLDDSDWDADSDVGMDAGRSAEEIVDEVIDAMLERLEESDPVVEWVIDGLLDIVLPRGELAVRIRAKLHADAEADRLRAMRKARREGGDGDGVGAEFFNTSLPTQDREDEDWAAGLMQGDWQAKMRGLTQVCFGDDDDGAGGGYRRRRPVVTGPAEDAFDALESLTASTVLPPRGGTGVRDPDDAPVSQYELDSYIRRAVDVGDDEMAWLMGKADAATRPPGRSQEAGFTLDTYATTAEAVAEYDEEVKYAGDAYVRGGVAGAAALPPMEEEFAFLMNKAASATSVARSGRRTDSTYELAEKSPGFKSSMSKYSDYR